MDIENLIINYEMANKLEIEGNIKDAFTIYNTIFYDDNCPKSLKLTVEKAISRIEILLSTKQYEPEITYSEKEVIDIDIFKLESIPSIENRMPIKQEDYDRMKEDIKRRGITTPLIVLPDYGVLCGYNRLKIAKELGFGTVPIIIKDVPRAGMLGYAIKDN